jgi:hypothetical protein
MMNCFDLEVVWLDRLIEEFYLKDENNDNNDEMHLKNDPFNIQVYWFVLDKISNERLM